MSAEGESSFVFSAEARLDILEIWNYLAENSIAVADRIQEEFYQAILRLVENPRMGQVRADLIANPEIRVWVVRSYLIFYRFDRRPLEIVRIISGYRDVATILSH